MEKFTKIGMYIVIGVFIYMLTESNAKILFEINKVKYNNFWSVISSVLKSFGYSLATIIIIIRHQKKEVKLGFVGLDMMVVFLYYFSDEVSWGKEFAFVYSIYTGLIMFFIGLMAFERLQKELKKIELLTLSRTEYNELQILKYKDELRKIKNTGKGISWNQDEDKVVRVEELESLIYELENEY